MCGHCRQPVHSWADGDLIGLQLVCADGVLTIRLVDFDVVLHRCGVDALGDEVERALAEVFDQAETTLQEVPC